MARTPEGAVKDAVRKILDALDVYYFMPPGMGFGVSGVFDIVCCVNGFFVGIECKRDAKTAPTALQTKAAQQTQACGGVAFLANGDNMTELAELLTRIKEYKYGVSWSSFWPFDSPAPFDKW